MIPLTDRRRNELRCYKDDAIMVPVEGRPGWIRCSVCGFVTQLVGYHAENVRRDFDEDEPDPRDGALYPNGHRAPLGRMDKRGGGGGGRRRRKKATQKRPAPKWTIA